MNNDNIPSEMVAWGALAIYIICDITKHIFTLLFNIIKEQIEKNKNERDYH